MQDEHYPGSAQKRRESPQIRHSRKLEERRETAASEAWDAHPTRRTVIRNGLPVTIEFFYIGALAKALGRRSVTIRSWIRKGWLPNARYSTRPHQGTRGDAGLRLWTRTQIEGIVKIASEEGLLGVWHPDVANTRFTERVFSAYRTWTS